MVASKCCRSVRWLVFALAVPGFVHAQQGPRAELTCVLGSGDLLGGSVLSAAEDSFW